MAHSTCRQRGFTFIEVIVTLAIIGILAVMAVPMLRIDKQRQKEHDLRGALSEIRAALDAYKRAADLGRIDVKIGESGYPRSLDDLVDGVEDKRSPVRQKIYFLRRLPADVMLNDSTLKPAATWGLRSYASPPDEPAEGDDVFDVYSTSEKIGLNGVPYKKW